MPMRLRAGGQEPHGEAATPRAYSAHESNWHSMGMRKLDRQLRISRQSPPQRAGCLSVSAAHH
eukprot:scaffold31574_cov33-Tisochrysis_lutea.AAC.3